MRIIDDYFIRTSKKVKVEPLVILETITSSLLLMYSLVFCRYYVVARVSVLVNHIQISNYQ